MPEAPTTNSGNQYFNNNECRSFGMGLGTSLTRLSGADSAAPFLGQLCSEVIIINSTGGLLTLFDNDYFGSGNGLTIADGSTFTLRGLTNVNQVSAKAASAGAIYYRTQFFSSNPNK
tara:strand:+ start:344 stop:694 length:351 start_codon:yes stop_codon:yes gene_type:complete